MADLVSGRRIGAFVVFCESEGVRHAVRLNAVLAIIDADDSQVTTSMLLPGGRHILIHAALDEVLD